VSPFLQADILASDNLSRAAGSAAAGGALWTVQAGVAGEGESSLLTWSASAAAGRERADGREDREETTWLAGVALAFPLGAGYRLETTAASSRATATAANAAGLLDSGSGGPLTRALTKQANAEAALSRTFPDGSSWKAGAGFGREERPGLRRETGSWSASVRRVVGLLTSVDVAIGGSESRDRASDGRDGKTSASLSLNLTATPRLTWGGELNWTGNHGRVASTDTPRSDDMGARVFAAAGLSPTTNLSGSLGAEGLKNGGTERKWAGKGDLSVSRALSPTLFWRVAASHRLSPAIGTLGETQWTRRSMGESSLEWRPLEKTTLTLRAAASRDRVSPGGSETSENLVGLAARQLF
jgi:hypothetical protein